MIEIKPALIKENKLYCPVCQTPLTGGVVDYNLYETINGKEKYIKFVRCCNNGCIEDFERLQVFYCLDTNLEHRVIFKDNEIRLVKATRSEEE